MGFRWLFQCLLVGSSCRRRGLLVESLGRHTETPLDQPWTPFGRTVREVVRSCCQRSGVPRPRSRMASRWQKPLMSGAAHRRMVGTVLCWSAPLQGQSRLVTGTLSKATDGLVFNWPTYNLAISRTLNLHSAGAESGLLSRSNGAPDSEALGKPVSQLCGGARPARRQGHNADPLVRRPAAAPARNRAL